MKGAIPCNATPVTYSAKSIPRTVASDSQQRSSVAIAPPPARAARAVLRSRAISPSRGMVGKPPAGATSPTSAAAAARPQPATA